MNKPRAQRSRGTGRSGVHPAHREAGPASSRLLPPCWGTGLVQRGEKPVPTLSPATQPGVDPTKTKKLHFLQKVTYSGGGSPSCGHGTTSGWASGG